ncbi:fatty acid synthase-like protein, partial [Dinothrombium tinctorium]
MDSFDEIVISGISGRFPQSNSIYEFRDNLFSGIDMVTEDDRWPKGEEIIYYVCSAMIFVDVFNITNRIAKLNHYSEFDAEFFEISDQEADLIDPQIRMLLEVVFECIYDAGMNLSSIKGPRTGIFMASFFNEIDRNLTIQHSEYIGYKQIFLGRLCHAFDVRGPSYFYETACSSASTCIAEAFSAIRHKQVDQAIIASCNISLSPTFASLFQKLGLVSKEGKCRHLDEKASGLSNGMMVATDLSVEEFEQSRIPNVCIACDNSKKSITVAGNKEAVSRFVEKLNSENRFVKVVKTNGISFHCPEVDLFFDKIREKFLKLMPQMHARSSKWISTSIQECNWQQATNEIVGEYFSRLIRATVTFRDAVRHIPKNAVIFEVSSRKFLTSILNHSLADKCTKLFITNGPSMNEQSVVDSALANFGTLYELGFDVNIEKLYTSVEYPFPNDVDSFSPLIKLDHSKPKLETKTSLKIEVINEEGKYKFIIAENNKKVVSGLVFFTEKENDEVDFDNTTDNETSALCLTSDDVYKEFEIRGYRYGDNFKLISEAKSDGSGARIRWTNNFVTFLDNMFQLHIVSNQNRSLRVPTRVNNIILNPKKFRSDQDIIAVYIDRYTEECFTQGIMIHGLKFVEIRRNSDLQEISIEKYVFVPYKENEERNVDYDLDLEPSIQIVAENVSGSLIKVTEINFHCEPFENLIFDILISNNHTSFNYYQLYFNESENTSKKYEYKSFLITEEFKFPSEVNASDVFIMKVKSKDLSKLCFESILMSLNENGFILFAIEQRMIESEIGELSKVLKMIVVYEKTYSNATIILFKKQRVEFEALINCENYSLSLKTIGDLSSFQWTQSVSSSQKNSPNLCIVHYSAFNFKDLMLSTGKLGLESIPKADLREIPIGMEFSGVDSKGNKIMGFVRSDVIAYHLVSDGIKSGVVAPLPKTIFSKNKIEDAFRFMSKGTHIGKILIDMKSDQMIQ